MITLTDQDLQTLNAYLQDVPLRYALPLSNYLAMKQAEQGAQAAQAKADKPKRGRPRKPIAQPSGEPNA